MTAAYIRILFHAANASLFSGAIPDTTAWAGPPPESFAIHLLLYAGLATSFFTAFLTMLGKRRVDQYLRNCGYSADDKSKERRRERGGSKRWRFQLVIKNLSAPIRLAITY